MPVNQYFRFCKKNIDIYLLSISVTTFTEKYYKPIMFHSHNIMKSMSQYILYETMYQFTSWLIDSEKHLPAGNKPDVLYSD